MYKVWADEHSGDWALNTYRWTPTCWRRSCWTCRYWGVACSEMQRSASQRSWWRAWWRAPRWCSKWWYRPASGVVTTWSIMDIEATARVRCRGIPGAWYEGNAANQAEPATRSIRILQHRECARCSSCPGPRGGRHPPVPETDKDEDVVWWFRSKKVVEFCFFPFFFNY